MTWILFPQPRFAPIKITFSESTSSFSTSTRNVMYCGPEIVSFGVNVVQVSELLSVKRWPLFGTMPLSLYLIDNPAEEIHIVVIIIIITEIL